MSMNINVTVQWSPEVLNELKQLRSIIEALGGKMALDFAKLNDALQKDTDTVSSVVTLINTMVQEIKDLKNQITDPTAQAAIDDLAAKFQTQTDALAASVAANTGV